MEAGAVDGGTDTEEVPHPQVQAEQEDCFAEERTGEENRRPSGNDEGVRRGDQSPVVAPSLEAGTPCAHCAHGESSERRGRDEEHSGVPSGSDGGGDSENTRAGGRRGRHDDAGGSGGGAGGRGGGGAELAGSSGGGGAESEKGDEELAHHTRRKARGEGEAVPRHRTVRIAPVQQEVPTLSQLCLSTLAEHCDSIVDIRGIERLLAIKLLREIMSRNRLTYKLAHVFIESGHDDLSKAVASLNLWDALPPGKHLYPRKKPGDMF